jgi:OOP family OmpA-OmpF porin
MLALRLGAVGLLLSLVSGCASQAGFFANVPILCSFDGSPPAPPSPPDSCGRIVLRGVNFAFDSAELDAASAGVLDVAAEQLHRCPNLAVHVAGYTDSVGSDAYDQGLSERRAHAVRGQRVDRGVSASRLTAIGYGESSPVASNDTAEGRALKRRVELKTG